MSSEEFARQFPNLAPMKDTHMYLRICDLAMQDLKKEECTKSKSSNNLENKLKLNNQESNKEVFWQGEYDNRSTLLHNLRFDKFPTISSEKLFVAAAKRINTENVVPISNYDLSSLGLLNVATNKGFEEIHNPASKNLSIKMFLKSNFSKSTGGIANFVPFHTEDGIPGMSTSMFLGEIKSIKEFQKCFFALFTLKSRATPWDKQLEPLWSFFIDKDYFENKLNCKQYYCQDEPGTFCAKFTDHILLQNATRFSNELPHLDKQENKHLFVLKT